jgi:hypothetical protein
MRKGGRGREEEREGGREGGIEREREKNHAHMHMHFSSARTILGKVVAVWHRDVAALAQPGNGVAIAAAAPVPAAEALQKFSKVSAQVHSLSRVTYREEFSEFVPRRRSAWPTCTSRPWTSAPARPHASASRPAAVPAMTSTSLEQGGRAKFTINRDDCVAGPGRTPMPGNNSGGIQSTKR